MDQITPKLGWNSRMVRYFLTNTQLSALLFVFIVISGVFAFARFRVEGFPSINIPLAVVTTVVPGAGPETINSSVTIPLESKVRDVKGIKDVSSQSMGGVSTIVINFREDADLGSSVQDVRNKIGQVKLPQGALDPEVFVPDISGAPYIVGIAGNKSLRELDVLSETLREKLLATDGVQSLDKISNAKDKIYIDVNPGTNQQTIISQLQAARVAFPLGQIEDNGTVGSLSASSQINSLDELKHFPISLPGQDGGVQILPLDSVASVYAGTDYGGQIHWLGYKSGDDFITDKALLYQIKLEPDADLLKTDEKVKAAIAETQSAIDGQAKVVVVFDQARESSRQVSEIIKGAAGGKWENDGPIAYVGYLFGAIWLLMIVMLLFLDWRSAIISVLSIPLSFLLTFAVLSLFGIQLNTIVLFSLVIVLGLIADPAIVVLESIKRYIEIGFRGNQAVEKSVDTIGRGVFIAVLTSLVVFLPFALVSGTFGQIIKYIPLTIIPALIASYFIPMLFLTWLGGKFLKPSKNRDHQPLDENDVSTLWRSARWFVKANRYILSRVWLSVLIVILGLAVPILISAGLIASGQIRQVQFSEPDDNQFVTISVPTGADLNEQKLVEKSDELETALAPYRKYMEAYFYGSLDSGAGGSQGLSVTITLLPKTERDINSKEITAKINSDLVAKFGEQAQASEIGTGPPEGAYPVSVSIFDADADKLQKASEAVAKELSSYDEVSAVRYDGQTVTTELKVSIKSEDATKFGLNAGAIYGQLAAVFSEQTIFSLGDEEVVIRVPKDVTPHTVDELRATMIVSQFGALRLDEVATVSEEAVPSAIKRLQGERFVQVSARVKDTRDIITVQRKIETWGKDNASRLGLGAKAFENRASQDEFEKSFQELFAAIGISILISYLIFVLFFKSFLQPFIILFAVPLIFVGVFPALVWLNAGQLGFLEIIGLIMVIGIVENVGIFMIDFANRKVGEGMHKREAIALSSGIRFRPIILTKLTAFAGFLPLAVFAPFWRGLAVVAIAGILSSGILSLFTTPILYSWLTRTKKPTI